MSDQTVLKKRSVILMIIFTFITIFLFESLILSSPSANVKNRLIFIGYKKDSYYCLLFEQVNRGFYYSYSEFVYLIKYKNDGSVDDKKLIRETYIYNTDGGQGNTVKEEKKEITFNLHKYLQRNDITYAIPFSASCEKYGFEFNDEGLNVTYNKGSYSFSKKLSYEELIKYNVKKDDNLKIIDYFIQTIYEPINPPHDYKNITHIYLRVHYGDQFMSDNYTQSIIVIKHERVK